MPWLLRALFDAALRLTPIWMAPTADHRLKLWVRVAAACVLVLLVAFGLWRTGSPLAGGAFAVLEGVGMLIAQPALDG